MKTIKIKTETGWKEIEISDQSFEGIEKETKPEFKVGDWVKIINTGFNINSGIEEGGIRRINKLDGDVPVRFYRWYITFDDGGVGGADQHQTEYLRHATPEEIKEHLIKEAEKRGFKEGVKYISVGLRTAGATALRKGDLAYYHKWGNIADVLTDGHGGAVYYQGKWAEIIKDDTIKVQGYNVEFAFNGNNIDVGCYEDIPFETVKKIYKRMKKLRK